MVKIFDVIVPMHLHKYLVPCSELEVQDIFGFFVFYFLKIAKMYLNCKMNICIVAS